jgi:formylglycine-generating enzyme required for sulfatase activity
MCNFIGWNLCDSNSSTWGNYKNATGTISKGHMGTADSYNDASHSYWILLNESPFEKYQNTKTVSATGSFVVSHDGKTNTTAQKNIYDVAGNVWEWTTEVPQQGYDETTNTGTHRLLRGGSTANAGDDRVADYRWRCFEYVF